ncbi:MAG: O-antigen ligase family protein [Crocinitomicaceae bacterium]
MTSLLGYLKQNYLYLFFIVLAFFPTVRILAFGPNSAQNTVQLVFSVLPEILFLVILLYWSLVRIKQKSITLHWLDRIVLLYLLYNLVVGIIFSGNLKLSTYSIRLTYLPMMIYFVASLSTFTFEKTVAILHKIFVFFVVFSVLGIVLYFVFPNIQHYFLNEVSHGKIAVYFVVRMTSLLWTPVVYSTVVMASLLYFSFKYLTEEKMKYLLFSGLLYFSLFMTMSRGAFVAVGFSMIILFVFSRKWKYIAHLASMGLIMFLLVGFYISNPINIAKWVFQSSVETAEMNDELTRVKLWKKTEKLSYTPFGLGLGKSGHVAHRFFTEDSDEFSKGEVALGTTDGWYKKLAFETGYLALIFYIGLILSFLGSFWWYYRKNGWDVLTFVAVFIIAVNVQNLVSNVNDFYLVAYLYWLVLGIFVLKLKQTRNG